MTTDTKDKRHSSTASGLRPADAVRQPTVRLAAGPFGVSAGKRGSDAPGLSGTLLTCLLIIYPAFATVAAIVAGLFLSAPTGGA